MRAFRRSATQEDQSLLKWCRAGIDADFGPPSQARQKRHTGTGDAIGFRQALRIMRTWNGLLQTRRRAERVQCVTLNLSVAAPYRPHTEISERGDTWT